MKRSGREELTPVPVKTHTSNDNLDTRDELDDDKGAESEVHSFKNVAAVWWIAGTGYSPEPQTPLRITQRKYFVAQTLTCRWAALGIWSWEEQGPGAGAVIFCVGKMSTFYSVVVCIEKM